MSMRVQPVSLILGIFLRMSRQKAHVPLCSLLNVCAVQLKRIYLCRNPLGGTENDISATPTVDGDRGDPNPAQAYMKKYMHFSGRSMGSMGGMEFLYKNMW